MKQIMFLVLVLSSTAAFAQSSGNGVPAAACAANQTYTDNTTGIVWLCKTTNNWQPQPGFVPWQTPTNGDCLVGNGSTYINGSCGSTTLPTSNAIGDTLFATAASSTTYAARTTSKIPVELYGVTAYSSEAAAEAGPDDTADFQAAVTAAAGGVALCQAGKWYHVEGPVNFITNEGLIGSSNQTYNAQCQLVSNSATTHILSAVGTSGAYLSGITWANLLVTRSVIGTGTSAGFYSSFVGGLIVTNTRSNNSIYDYYRHASPGYGIGYWSYNQASWTASSGTYYGFYDDSADGNAEASILLDHSAVDCKGLSGSAIGYGQILTGEAVNDDDSWDFNTSNCQYGQVVNYTGSGGTIATNDIHFFGSTHDGTKTSCWKISNTSQATDGFVEINGGHCDSVSSTSSLIDIESSFGVKVSGVSITQPTSSSASAQNAIYAASSSNLNISNNIITYFGTSGGGVPVEFNGTSHSVFSGNVVLANSANSGNIVWFHAGSTYNSVTGNSLSGYSTAGAGLSFDSTSNYNGYSGNGIDVTHITSATPIADAGTANGPIQPTNVSTTFTNTAAIAHVPIATYYGPNATYGSTCLVYDIFGVASTNSNSVLKTFGCLGSGSATNWYGWSLTGATSYSERLYNNASAEIGETTPAAGPANGLAVGTTGQKTIDGNGVVHEAGSAPVASVGTITGTNNGGYVSGLSSATTTTLTFANSGWSTWASCVASDSQATTPVQISAISKTAVTFTFASLTGTLYYHCDGN
jgi:hypothetical protein